VGGDKRHKCPLQALFGGIGYPGWSLPLPLPLPGTLTISMYIAPPWFAKLLNVVSAVVLVLFFRDSYVGVLKKPEKKENSEELESKASKLPPPDRMAVAACLAIRFTTLFVFTNIET